MNNKEAVGMTQTLGNAATDALSGMVTPGNNDNLKGFVVQKLQGLAQTGLNMEDPAAVENAMAGIVAEGNATQEQVDTFKNDPMAMDEVKQQATMPVDQTAPPTPMTPTAFSNYDRKVSGSATLLQQLNTKYAKADLDLTLALKVWKEAKLTPQDIRDQVRNDVGQRVTVAEAKTLYKMGSQLQLNNNYINQLFNQEEAISDIHQRMASHKTIRLTPNVRASIEKIGQNLFRTKRANILWKIDMMIDGDSQIPYLVRVDTTEASDEDTKREV